MSKLQIKLVWIWCITFTISGLVCGFCHSDMFDRMMDALCGV